MGRPMKSARHLHSATISEAASAPELVSETADTLPILWTSREVAEALKVTPSTLCRWRATGKGPRVYWLSPDSPRYRRSDVLAWLEEVAA